MWLKLLKIFPQFSPQTENGPQHNNLRYLNAFQSYKIKILT